MTLHFDKYAQEANEFMNKLAKDLGHPDERNRAGMILRAVMHTLRDRITISESFNVLAQLPMFLKAVYVENWKYSERPATYSKIEDFKNEVKKQQELYGEQDFNWQKSTEEIIHIVMDHLKQYISQGEIEDIMAQLPEELEELVR